MKTLKASDLHQFTGDLVRFRQPLFPNICYTPGVKHVAEAGQAYWLIDAISALIGSPQFVRARNQDPRIGHMHFWRIQVEKDQTASLTARVDSDQPEFIHEALTYTDFPLSSLNIWAAFDGRYWTLYLASEH